MCFVLCKKKKKKRDTVPKRYKSSQYQPLIIYTTSIYLFIIRKVPDTALRAAGTVGNATTKSMT